MKQHNKRKKYVYKKDKCRCGNLKGVRAKTCRKCFLKGKNSQLARLKNGNLRHKKVL